MKLEPRTIRITVMDFVKRGSWFFRCSISNETNILITAVHAHTGDVKLRFFTSEDRAADYVDALIKHDQEL